MANKKYWTPIEVESYLKNLKPGARRILPDDVYCTKNFTWNEVLLTKSRNIDIPSLEILENLKSSADVLQTYRNKIGKPITITSGWRTPTEQKNLIRLYNMGKQKYKPSETSLHLEGLALDFAIAGSQYDVQKIIDENHFGEVEIDSGYTHVGLPTFSKSYLQRNNLNIDKFYRKLSSDGITINDYERSKIVKRMNAKNWGALPSNYNSQRNAEIFANNSVDNNTYNLNKVLEGYVYYNDYQFDKYEKNFQDIFISPEESFETGYAAPINLNLYNLTQPQSVFTDYTNPLTGNNRIFTREEIGAMNDDEFAQNEKEIMAQIQAMNGIMPTNGDMLRESLTGGGVIYVHPYTRADGTEVQGYYRSRPGM